MPRIAERAPAKINLTLRVAGRRPDGFHELQSLVAFARDIADLVTFEPGLPPQTSVTGPFSATIAGENLLDLTLAKVRAAAPLVETGRVTLEKNLPVAAGIGGGSADAGALLRTLQQAYPGALQALNLNAIAAGLGADVPVCLLNRPAWMTGIGECLAPIEALPALEAVLVNPLKPMPANKTAQVFRALAAGQLDAAYAPPAAPRFTTSEALLANMRKTGNDLEHAAETVAPIIADVKGALASAPGCLYAAVSGSGPTCFGIFENAAEAARCLAGAHPDWWVRASRIS